MTYLDTKLNIAHAPKYKTNASRMKLPSPVFQKKEFLSPNDTHSDFKKSLISNERALKQNSSNLSFKGSFFRVLNGYSTPIKNYKAILKQADSVMANVPSEMISKIQKARPQDIITEGDAIKFKETGIFHKIVDAAIYPVAQMPLDLANFAIKSLQKIPALSDSKTLKNLYNSDFLTKNRERIYLSEQVGALNNVLSNASKLDLAKKENKEAFLKQVHSLFDPKKGNYNTAHERALNRIVSGIIPAFFLANDAYNLSRYCDDNKQAAEKEHKIRFNQEVARVGTTAYLQLVILGGLSKIINSSIWGAVLSSTGITISTELLSRKLNGKPVWLLNKEDAKKQYELEYNDFLKKQKKQGVNYQYFKMPVAFKKNKTFASFAQNEIHAKNEQGKTNKRNKPPISLSDIVNYSVASTIVGLGLFALRKNNKNVDDLFKKAFKPFKDKYNSLAFTKLTVKKDDLTYLANRFEKAGYKDIADGYKNIISKQNGDEIVFGTQTTKKKPLVDFVIGPSKFIWKTLTLPYNLTKKVLALPIKSLRTKAKSASPDKQILGDGIGYLLEHTKKMDDNQFKNFVDKKILSSFDKSGKSSYSNADLAIMTKLFCSTATSFFLVADHYNMVMTKSKGEDKKGAVLKAKERIAQRVSSTFYSTLFIDLFNNTFKKAYHASLLGMSAVTAACTYLSENFTRISIGMPVLKKSKNEIENIENTNNSRDGLLGKYFRFMSRLTGKKILSEQKTNK